MFKILFLGLNFLNVLNYNIIKEEEVNYEEIVYEDENYIIYKEDGLSKLKTKNDEWIRILNINGKIDAFLVENDLYIFNYVNGVFKCIVYNSLGEIIQDKLIFENNILNYKIKYSDGFYIVGSLNQLNDEIFKNCYRDGLEQKNAFILRLDKMLTGVDIRLYGGLLDDEFFDIGFSNQYIYVAGKKDVLTSGDFGNGGKNNGDIFIVRMDYNLEIINYLVVNDASNIVRIDWFKDYLYIASRDYLYKVDFELNLQRTNKLSEAAIFSIPAYFNKYIVVSNNNTYVYDLLTLNLVCALENNERIENVKEFMNILYIKTINHYYFDLACLEGIKYLDQYYSETKPKLEVDTIFGRSTYLDDMGDIVFDPLVYGTYLRKLKFRNAYGVEFLIQRNSTVPKHVNVSEGGIYPIGYNLLFTGRAYLNGNSIAYNYSIASAGEYSLRLVGVGDEEVIINFKVDSDQISFSEEKVRDYHNVVNFGEAYYLSVNYSSLVGDVNSVVVDGVTYYDIIVNKENKLISIKMPPSNYLGLKYHIINGVNYKRLSNGLEEEYYVDLDLIYIVNVLKDVMSIEINQINNDEYYFRIDDYNSARYFLLSYIYNNKEYSFKYPIGSNKVFLDEVPHLENITVYLQIYYDLGDKSYRKIDLMELDFNNINNNDILEIDVLKKEESLQEFRIKILNDKISKITISDKDVYKKIEKDYHIHFIIGFIMLGGFAFIIYKIRHRNYNRKLA